MKYSDDSYYHVYNRGAHKRRIFFEDATYEYLIRLMTKYSTTYRTVIAAYCLMPNHYHLVVRQREEGSIGVFLKTTFNAFTQAVNKRFGLSGTLFQGQAKVKEIDSDQYCVKVIRYVHTNPCKAGLVVKAEDWPFSNYREWIGMGNGILMDVSLRDRCFGTPEEYKQFAQEALLDDRSRDIGKYLFDENE